MVERSGFFDGFEPVVVTLIGLLEILLGMVLLFSRSGLLHYINILLLVLLGCGAVFQNSAVLQGPFNPFVISLPMMALSFLALKTRE